MKFESGVGIGDMGAEADVCRDERLSFWMGERRKDCDSREEGECRYLCEWARQKWIKSPSSLVVA